jgi:hypothetical protein
MSARPYEHRGSTCPAHGNAYAMRRARGESGPWQCLGCDQESTLPESAAAQAASPTQPPSERVQACSTPTGSVDADLPPGWRRTRPHEANSPVNYEHVDGVTVWGPHDAGWSYCCHPPYGIADGNAPTALQAMCAALGYALAYGQGWLQWSCDVEARTQYSGYATADALARVVLERHHALNSKPAAWPGDETDAELLDGVRAMDHDRSSCDVCRANGVQGSPELSARERGRS